MQRARWILAAAFSLAAVAPALAQQSGRARVPSAAQVEVAAEMNATGSPYVAPAPPAEATPAEPSQSFGNGAGPTFRLGGVPVGVDAGVEQPYSNSWAEDVGGQPASSNHGAVLARLFGTGTQP